MFVHFTNQKSLKPSLAQKLKPIFKFSTITGQIYIPLWTHIKHKGWRKDGKTFIRCYTIALKLWDEFNVNFVLLYFSSYSSIKMWHFFVKNVEKNSKAVHLRLVAFEVPTMELQWCHDCCVKRYYFMFVRF